MLKKISATDKANHSPISILLVGNPNCGKTTLFNHLVGARQHVGNWPGVTVERKLGHFTQNETIVEVVDLPGVYSLTIPSNTSAEDERIAVDAILASQFDLIINIVDASHLERHLYLTMQLLEMDKPVILVLNMMDIANRRKIKIDINALSAAIGCPIVPLSANKKNDVNELKQKILTYHHHHHASHKLASLKYPETIENALCDLQKINLTRSNALRLLENVNPLECAGLERDVHAKVDQNEIARQSIQKWQVQIMQSEGEDADVLIADARYKILNQIMLHCVKRGKAKRALTTLIDSVVLNRVLSIPIFFVVMYALFFFAINIGGAFQDFFDISSQTIFVDGFANLLNRIHTPTWLTVLLANGLGKGINTTITFIPVIGAMFLFLAFLEDSGYMARAAFVVDRFMRVLGLPGKAFVPMIVGFGCNVPAVMGARTLENKDDRILTIMMAPFMSCGARLAIFAVFSAAFFPKGGQNIIFLLYLIGIFMAVITGFILRHRLLKGDPSPLIMELPPYHMPQIKTLMLHAWHRLKSFVFRAGRLIVPICVLIGALNSFNLDGTMNTGEGDTHSLLSTVGHYTTSLFTPMGLNADNWLATVGLITGVLAKEVVIGTLNTLYTQMGHLTVASSADFHFWANLNAAFNSIGNNFLALKDAFINPVLAKAPIDPVNQGVLGLMYQKFDGKVGAFAYLLFVLLYFPCISTTAAMLRELNKGWAVFSAFWMTGVAYGSAVLFYQAATWYKHPYSASAWIIAILFVFFATIFLMRPSRDINLSSFVENEELTKSKFLTSKVGVTK